MGYKLTELVGRVSPLTGNSTSNKHTGTGVDNVAWESPSIPAEYYRHFITITCYKHLIGDKTQDIVATTGGKVVITASDDGVHFGNVTDGTVELAKPDYKRPNFCGRIASIKADITGVTPKEHDDAAHVPEGTVVVVQIHSYS